MFVQSVSNFEAVFRTGFTYASNLCKSYFVLCQYTDAQDYNTVFQKHLLDGQIKCTNLRLIFCSRRIDFVRFNLIEINYAS